MRSVLSENVWLVVGIIAFAIAVPLIVMVLLYPSFYPHYGGYYGMMGGFAPGPSVLVWIGGLLVLIVVLLLVVSLFRSEGNTHAASPEDLLRTRLANGEIGEDEFNRRMNALRSAEKSGEKGD